MGTTRIRAAAGKSHKKNKKKSSTKPKVKAQPYAYPSPMPHEYGHNYGPLSRRGFKKSELKVYPRAGHSRSGGGHGQYLS